MKMTSLQMLILASAAASVSGYPLVATNKRYGTWIPFRAHPPAPYIETYSPPSQEELVDFYYPSEPLHYYQLPYYYGLPEYYYETNEEEDEPDQWYVGSNAEANALFLHNLMLAQLYNAQKEEVNDDGERIWPSQRENDNEDDELNEESDTYVYGEPKKTVNPLPKEDRDVRELKSLVENRWVDRKRNSEKKLVARNQIRQEHKPSAYDAIKKLLIQQEKKDTDNRRPHKRSYTPNEDSLVEQLGSLKKI